MNQEEYLTRLKMFVEVEGHECTPELVEALRYFIERERLVQRLIERIDPDDPLEADDDVHRGWVREMECDARRLRDFEVKP